MPTVEIRPLRTAADAGAFRALNEEWITRYFALEPKDRETLGDPENTILGKGGRVYVAQIGSEVVGCVALIPEGGDIYELSKMAVSPEVRGLGIGRQLLAFAIEQARAMGAQSLWLGSNTRLQNAVHLYESVGFEHVPPEQLPASAYARCDVFMVLKLQRPESIEIRPSPC
jgi:ribosomal protein S18 acetylase RimI-like enzyme